MAYKVIENFADLKDGNHNYKVGDEYPRKGAILDKKRAELLASKRTKRGRPVIAEVVEEKPKASKTAQKKKEQ